MCSKFVQVIIFQIILQLSSTERRIKNGFNVANDKRFMAYLVKAPSSPTKYDAWLCGGAIVAPKFILTAAACVADVQHMYAIAGYRKYVPADMIAVDQCTRLARKKVIQACLPKQYEFAYDKIEKWGYIDIAIVQVESPYDFNAPYPLPFCSWVPNQIEINYDPKYQEPGTDSVVFGWGHNLKWREPNDPVDYNQKQLQYVPLLLQSKNKCKKHFPMSPELNPIIEKYMICAWDAGNLDDEGYLIVKPPRTAAGCSYNGRETCEEVKKEITRDGNREEFLEAESWESKDTLRHMESGLAYINDTNGICQNDHGGPLVTWIGSHEVVIGVASVFKVSSEFNCVGPYLFTSTQCNGAFIDCIINPQSRPAENELEGVLIERPQIPLYDYAYG